jgi:hypothetical protein
MNKKLRNQASEAIGYFSSRMEDLNEEHQFYLDIILQYLNEIEYENKELEDQVYYLKKLTATLNAKP